MAKKAPARKQLQGARKKAGERARQGAQRGRGRPGRRWRVVRSWRSVRSARPRAADGNLRAPAARRLEKPSARKAHEAGEVGPGGVKSTEAEAEGKTAAAGRNGDERTSLRRPRPAAASEVARTR